MGLFAIAGVLIIFGGLYWALDEKGSKYWTFAAKLICSIVGGAMLFVLLLIMGTNRADAVVLDMEEDYIMCMLALEGCDTINEYMAIADKINAYNDTVEQHRKMRNNELTNWLFSPKIAKMPLIVVPDYKLQEAE
jgi:hypothetical protein